MKYGTREWLEEQYQRGSTDPWGLDWRASQQFRYHVMLEALRAQTGPSWRPTRIIDVGCATGSFTARLGALSAAPVSGLIGVDIAEAAVHRARQRFPEIEFERMDFDQCAERFEESADLVTCLEVLYYIPADERAAAIRALRRMLRPSGLLLISSMSARSPYLTLAELRELIGAELELIGSASLYLKPLNLVEKAIMRASRLWPGSDRRLLSVLAGPQSRNRVASIATWSERLLGERACSHGYVVARAPRAAAA